MTNPAGCTVHSTNRLLNVSKGTKECAVCGPYLESNKTNRSASRKKRAPNGTGPVKIKLTEKEVVDGPTIVIDQSLFEFEDEADESVAVEVPEVADEE